MVRRQGVGFNDNFKTMILEIPDNFEVQEILPKDLPSGWRRFTDYSKCQPIGNKWYDEGLALVLKVPSAVLPEAFNYVVNATHAGFKNIKLLQVTDLIPDERIEDLLKKYKKL